MLSGTGLWVIKAEDESPKVEICYMYYDSAPVNENR